MGKTSAPLADDMRAKSFWTAPDDVCLYRIISLTNSAERVEVGALTKNMTGVKGHGTMSVKSVVLRFLQTGDSVQDQHAKRGSSSLVTGGAVAVSKAAFMAVTKQHWHRPPPSRPRPHSPSR